MPANIQLAALTVHLLGNVLLCMILASYYKKPIGTGTAAGVVRTLIGVALAALLAYSFHSPAGRPVGLMSVLVFAWVRLMEWAAIFWIFFRDPPQGRIFVPMILFAGVIYSGVLDLMADVFGGRGIGIL